YKPVEAFKMDLERSPPETTYERCKHTILLAQSLLSGARSSETGIDTTTLSCSGFSFAIHISYFECRYLNIMSRNMVDHTKSLPRPWLSAAIVELKNDDDIKMEQILYGLALMKEAAIIHCDLKPKNR
nr:hypothetical protein [Tanacetum cinerariifolium]